MAITSILDSTVALIDWPGYCLWSGNDPTLDAASLQNRVENLINSASQWIRDYCNRDLLQTPRTWFTNYQKKTLLPSYPIVSPITAVYYDPQRQWGAGTQLVENVDYRIDYVGGILYFIGDSAFNVNYPFWNTPFLKQYLDFPEIVRVDGTWGYPFASMPYQLKQATFELVMWYMKRIQSNQIGSRMTIGDAMTTTFDLTPPLNILNMLQPHKDQYKRSN